MKRLGLLALCFGLIAGNSAFALSLTLENQTGKELHELYFAPAGEKEWGPDQLGDKVVANDETFTLSKIPKGKYDVMFVDESGAKCDIRDVDFTESELFVMTKQLIKGCQAGSEQADGDEE
jgi:hypothetical protein